MKLKLAMVCAATVLAAPAAQAFEIDHVGARAGTMGLGAELGAELFPFLNARLIANKFDLGFDTDLDDVNYDGDIALESYGLQADVTIPGTLLYVSGGLYYNRNALELTARPTTNVVVGDIAYTPAQVGALVSTFEFDEVAPYAGVGVKFGVPKVELNLEAGALFQGAPRATLKSTGALKDDPTFRGELEQERKTIEEELEEFEIYPSVNASLRFKF
jgi:hypothetical protein